MMAGRAMLAALASQALFLLAAHLPDAEPTCNGCQAPELQHLSWMEVEQLEAEEGSVMQMELLQTRVEVAVRQPQRRQALQLGMQDPAREASDADVVARQAASLEDDDTWGAHFKPKRRDLAPVLIQGEDVRVGTLVAMQNATTSVTSFLQTLAKGDAVLRARAAFMPAVVHDLVVPPPQAHSEGSSHNAEAEKLKRQEFLEGVIPSVAILLGFIFAPIARCRIIGLLLVYFGIQTGLNLYMKIVLSSAVVSNELDMKGIPGAFLITAMQQVVSFMIFIPMLALLWFTPWRYTPKPLTTGKAWLGLVGLSITFALNIGLNNLCLSLLPMSINLMIRSCIPLATWLLQSCLSACCVGVTKRSSRPAEIILMLIGVFFAGLASVAKSQGSAQSEETSNLLAGVAIGVLSLGACACYLLLAQWLGQDMALNPMDMTLYMSVPSAMFLLPLMFFLQHPVGWPGFGSLTDWQVLRQVLDLSPSLLSLVCLSGVFAVFYNTLQYTMVKELSATHTAFAGNFNKAATIVLSLSLGLEALPAEPWGAVTILCIVGSVASFTGYSLLKT